MKAKTVSGTVAIGVTGKADGPQRLWATVGAHGWLVVVRIDTQSLATLDKIPARVGFDTRQTSDGPHTLSLTLLNSETDQELATDSMSITIENGGSVDTASAAAVPVAPPSAATDTPLIPGAQPTNGNLAATPTSSAARRTLALPVQATQTKIGARVSASPDPLRASATLLVRSGTRLYLGLADGGVAWCGANTTSRGGSVVRLPSFEGEATSLVCDDGRIWWTTTNGACVYACHESDRSVTRYDVSASYTSSDGSQTSAAAPLAGSMAAGWVRRVALLRGQPLLLGDGGLARVLDPKTGSLTDPSSPEANGLLPLEAIASLPVDSTGRCAYCVSSAGSGIDLRTMLVSLSPAPYGGNSSGGRNQLRAWQCGADGAWRMVGETGTGVEPTSSSLFDMTAFGAATVERDCIRVMITDVKGQPATPRDLYFDHGPGIPGGADRVALGGSGVWWVSRGTVFHADPFSGSRDAYLPWNVTGMGGVQALTADRDGLWIATTNKGVRHVQPGSPTESEGYGGFVRIRLGDDTAVPETHRDQAIAAAIEEWQGTPYVWGGESREGTDCSGFVGSMHRVAGVEIPRTTAEMAVCRQGKRVRDELRWGDTLVFPGHCAMYVGNGRTAETVGGSGGGSVSHASIWSHTTVVVRRFLP